MVLSVYTGYTGSKGYRPSSTRPTESWIGCRLYVWIF